MPDLTTIEQATGERLEAGREYERHSEGRDFVSTHTANAALAEAYERIMRLQWQRDYVVDIAEEYGHCDFTSEDVLSLDELYARWTAKEAEHE